MFRLQIGRCIQALRKTVIQERSRFVTKLPAIQHGVRQYSAYRMSERDFLQQMHDPDTFGSSTQSQFDTTGFDEDEEQEEKYISEQPHGLRTKQYADLIKGHLQAKRIKEAIDVLEVKMIKEDRVKPENYIYNLLIGGCARAGYTKKAFHLFTRMKQRGLVVTGGTYTSLFNACAMSPFKSDALLKANHLRELMKEKGYEPNLQNYNAMIKAYGRLGDILTAFQLVDEMVTKRLPVRLDTMNHLLQACATNQELGFRHALLVWSKMLRWRQNPDLYSFNLLLRVIRDCGIGDVETTEEVVQKICSGQDGMKLLASGDTNEENGEQVTPELIGHEKNLPLMTTDGSEIPESAVPNLIARKPHLGQLIALKEVLRPEDRLLLVGGMRGFLLEMETCGVTPDVKTFTELLEVIPSTITAEKFLLSMVRKYNLRVDIDFFNILIKKRSMRFDYGAAKEVLKMIKTAKLSPDIVTYGVLALGCQTEAEAHDLMAEMEKAGIRMNMAILGAMLKQGCLQWNFDYVMSIMDIVMREEIKPNAQFLTHLHKFYKKTTALIRQRDPRIENEREFSKSLFEFKVKMESFNSQFDLVDRNLEESIKRIQVHPYQQFKEPQDEGYERSKTGKKRMPRKKMRKLGDDLENEDDPKKDLIESH